MAPAFDIDPRIGFAETPPASFYRNAQAYAQQLERVFARSWQCLHWPRESAANLQPLTLLPDAVSEPLLLVRSGEAWRCFSNVCTHRGALLCADPVTRRFIQCPYHGRTFDLNGQMLAMPAFEQAENFPRPADHLPELPLRTYGPLHFTSLNPQTPFEEWIAPVRERLDWLPWEQFRFAPEYSRDYPLAAHWALYCDNYLEGLHIPYIHPALNAALDFKAYRTILLPEGVLQIGIAAEGELCFEPPAHHPDAGLRIAAWYFWLFPNLMINVYPWGLSLNVVEPRGLERSCVRYLTWVWREEWIDQGAGANTDQTEQEDHGVILRVQQGIQSRLYQRGRYSPSMEQGVHHFHRLLCSRL